MPKQKSYQAPNFNEVLNFTEEKIICGQREILWDDFKTMKKRHGSENCLLKNGENMTIGQLWVELIQDYSFEMSPNLTAL